MLGSHSCPDGPVRCPFKEAIVVALKQVDKWYFRTGVSSSGDDNKLQQSVLSQRGELWGVVSLYGSADAVRS